MTNNSDLIVVKTILEHSSLGGIVKDIDISKLNINENEAFIITVIYQFLGNDKTLIFTPPKEYKLELKETIQTFPDTNIFIFKNGIFKLEYNHRSNKDELIIFSCPNNLIFIFSEFNSEVKIYNQKEIAIPLTKSGTYYFDFYDINNNGFENKYFSYYISGKIIDNIDLSERLYYYKTNHEFKVKLNPELYKVTNLKNDTYVFFEYEPNKYGDFINPIEVCDRRGCKNDIVIYKFLKDKDYTINANYIRQKYNSGNYYIPTIFFFPLMNDTIEEKDKLYAKLRAARNSNNI
jgi:hypothetical protein